MENPANATAKPRLSEISAIEMNSNPAHKDIETQSSK